MARLTSTIFNSFWMRSWATAVRLRRRSLGRDQGAESSVTEVCDMMRLSLTSDKFKRVLRGALLLACALIVPGRAILAQSSATVTIPASTAAGIALASAASRTLSQDNQWKDYEDIIVVSTLNEVAKAAANTGRPMSTADYNLIAMQVRAWLDSKNPQSRLLSGDQAVWLRYAIDSLAPLASSAQADPLLPGAIGSLERLKFGQLENPLDPTRQYPADLALPSAKMNAYRFVADRIQEASDLAFNAAQFAAAVNSILKDLTGVDTSNTYDDIRNLYPYAVPILPASNADGSYTLSTQNLIAQYQSIVAFAQCGIDNSLGSIESPQSVPANCAALAASPSTFASEKPQLAQLAVRDAAAADAP